MKSFWFTDCGKSHVYKFAPRFSIQNRSLSWISTLPSFQYDCIGLEYCVWPDLLFHTALLFTTSQSILFQKASRYRRFPSTPWSKIHTCSHVLTPSSTSSSTPPGARSGALALFKPKLPACWPAAATSAADIRLVILVDSVFMSLLCFRKCARGYGEPAM